eukprot:gi/632990901/ref/XP_007884382.1/ PREDICTED: E3 ubiquitin-protein ligase TRIM39-like isoform X2 [Callorhinchus milii]
MCTFIHWLLIGKMKLNCTVVASFRVMFRALMRSCDRFPGARNIGQVFLLHESVYRAVSVPLNSSWSVIPTRTATSWFGGKSQTEQRADGEMASEQELENLRNEATCSICLEFYTDPVSTDCGHNFCRDCILQCWGTGQESVSCPQCRQQIPQRCVRPNRTLSNIVESVQRLSLNLRLEEVGIQCEEHQEKLKLFCETDQRAICVVCAMSHDHKDHTVIPIKEAAELCKQKLQKALETLQEQLGEMSQCQREEGATQMEVKRQAERLRKNIDAEFAKRHQLLIEEQRDLITKLRQQEEAILGQIENNKSDISKQITSVNQRIAEIQTRLTLQNTEFLKVHRLCVWCDRQTVSALMLVCAWCDSQTVSLLMVVCVWCDRQTVSVLMLV